MRVRPLILRAMHLCCALLLVLLLAPHPALAQRREPALSEGEVEQLRDAAYVPNDRVLVFVKLIDSRTKAIQDLFAKPRRPGREQETHDLFEQLTAVADELDDNLDDYGPRHRDIRKALPKLLAATERWSSGLKSVPNDEAYNVSRKLALESIRDIRETATKLVEEQKSWFLAHPPAKDDKEITVPL